MIKNVLDFFRNLPAKRCSVCATEMTEQHDCYSNKCDKCSR